MYLVKILPNIMFRIQAAIISLKHFGMVGGGCTSVVRHENYGSITAIQFLYYARFTGFFRLPIVVQCHAPYVSRCALENFQNSWKHKWHSGNIKGNLSARMPLMSPNLKKSWKHKGHGAMPHGTVFYHCNKSFL